MFCNALKRKDNLSGAAGPGFSWSWSGKMARTKKDTNARVAWRRKQIKESVAEQLCMDNIPLGLNEFDETLLSNSTKESLLTSLSSSQIFTEPSTSLDSFLLDWYHSHSFVRQANSPFFTHLCILFVIRCSLTVFRTGPRSFPWFTFTYNLRKLHLIRKILGGHNNKNSLKMSTACLCKGIDAQLCAQHG